MRTTPLSGLPAAWRPLVLTAEEFEQLGADEAAAILTARFQLFRTLGWDWKTALLLSVHPDDAAIL